VHPLRQNRFLLVKHLRPSNVLPARPTRLARCCPTFPTELKFKLGHAGEHTGHHAAGGVARVDALAQ